MRRLVLVVGIGAALVLSGSLARAVDIGIPSKFKAKKVQGNLVPAFMTPAGSGHGDDESDMPAFIAVATPRTNCTFDSGKFKAQAGSDISVKLKGVTCGGVAVNGSLCAHSKVYSTVANVEIDKDGNTTAKMCVSNGTHTEGLINFVTGSIGLLSCSDGSCSGTLPTVTMDPCPDVDKVAELRRLEVFSGPDKAVISVLGTTLTACCGPGQTVIGGAGVGGTAPCNTSTQDVFAEIGNAVQVAP